MVFHHGRAVRRVEFPWLAAAAWRMEVRATWAEERNGAGAESLWEGHRRLLYARVYGFEKRSESWLETLAGLTLSVRSCQLIVQSALIRAEAIGQREAVGYTARGNVDREQEKHVRGVEEARAAGEAVCWFLLSILYGLAPSGCQYWGKALSAQADGEHSHSYRQARHRHRHRHGQLPLFTAAYRLAGW
jgi:hypothetical protein